MAEVKKRLPSNAGEKKPLKRAAPADEIREFKLSTEYIDPSDSLQDYSILLFGEKKIGKTRLTTLFPDLYMIKTEQGSKGVRHRGDNCTSWRLFRKMLRLLKNDKCRTVGIDTVDLLFKQCFDYVCAKMGMDHPADEAWGKGWSGIRDEFTAGMQELMGMGKGVILISHATEREIKKRDGSKYDRIQPTMAGQARDICEAIVDIWAYFTYDGSDRILVLRGDEHISAGHRLDTRFRYNGKEVRQILMTDHPETGYKNFVDAFNNKYKPRPEDVETEEEEVPPKLVKKIKKLKQPAA